VVDADERGLLEYVWDVEERGSGSRWGKIDAGIR
jgi:hypothetical protein